MVQNIGRPSMRPYIIAVRLKGHSWAATDGPAIRKAHIRYDAGEVEICQGVDATHDILYMIPRVIRQKRAPFFFPLPGPLKGKPLCS